MNTNSNPGQGVAETKEKTITKEEFEEMLKSLHKNEAIEITVRHYGKVSEYLIIKSDGHIEEDIYVAFEYVPPRKPRSQFKWYFKRKEGGWWELFWSFTPSHMSNFTNWMFQNNNQIQVISLTKHTWWNQ